MKILLAIDGSPGSEAAVTEVTKRPWPASSEIRIVSAFEVPLSPTPEAWAISSEYFDQMERVAREQAQAVVKRRRPTELTPLQFRQVRTLPTY